MVTVSKIEGKETRKFLPPSICPEEEEEERKKEEGKEYHRTMN